MNQRFQNEEIKLISEQYAENELYKAVNSIGLQLEIELKEFGLCPEECFMETLELLSEIANKGEAILPELENLWLRKENEYRRYNRQVSIDEIRKSVGIVFGFVILAIDSSRHRFYRYTLSEQLTMMVANHKWEGWSTTLGQIFSVPLPDGWFDAYIDEEPENDGDMADFAKTVNSLRKHMPNAPLVVQLVQRQYNNCCQQFFAPISNCTIMMPAASQSSKQKAEAKKATQPTEVMDVPSELNNNGRKRGRVKQLKGISHPPKYMTLKYVSHGDHKELVNRQRNRVKILFEKWKTPEVKLSDVGWGWLDASIASKDFCDLFEGKDRCCNLKIKRGKTNVVSIFFTRLLKYIPEGKKKTLIEGQTKQSAPQIMLEQFGVNAINNLKRLSETDIKRIKESIYILDWTVPLPQMPGGGDTDYDLSDTAIQLLSANIDLGIDQDADVEHAVKSGVLRKGKHT